MQRKWRQLLGMVLGLFVCAAASGQQAPVEELTREAQLIFQGTVQKVRATNLEAVEANGNTAVVRVDEVLKAPPTLDDFTGREVTVWLAEPDSASPGEQMVLFTRGWFYGETLGVVEVGRAARDTVSRTAVAEADRRHMEQRLKERLDRSELVVAGRVLETRPAGKVGEERVTEHDPQWREAVIRIDSLLKGRHEAGTVVILYPGTLDVMWADSPKPRVGQERVWLLHKDQVEGLEIYTALKPEDVLPRTEVETVRRLVTP